MWWWRGWWLGRMHQQQIAEGTGRWPRAEQRGAYAAARGVVLEVVPLLELARRASLLPIEMHESLRALKHHDPAVWQGRAFWDDTPTFGSTQFNWRSAGRYLPL